MYKVLFVSTGFIGDRLLTTSAMAVAKRYYPDIKTYYYLSSDFSYMNEVLLSTGIVDGIITDKTEIDGRWDSVFTMPHCRFDTNPVRVYCESFIENLPIDADLTPAFVDVTKLNTSENFTIPTTDYITYQVDWQNRTSLDVELIISLLQNKGITCIPVGSLQKQQNEFSFGSNEFIQQEQLRRYSLNETFKLIAGAKMHLCMNGGTAMFSGYVHTRCAMTTDWFYIRHNERRLDPYAYLNWIKQTPRDMSGNPIHHMFNPNITEEELVTEVSHMLTCMHDFILPPNLIKYPQLIDFFVRNDSVSFNSVQK
jgi:hypothetical protein